VLPVDATPRSRRSANATSGLPRKVNGLAHHALTAAALARKQTVTAEHVQAALPETT
jgi:hypothetical protein